MYDIRWIGKETSIIHDFTLTAFLGTILISAILYWYNLYAAEILFTEYWECTQVIESRELYTPATCDQWTRKDMK